MPATCSDGSVPPDTLRSSLRDPAGRVVKRDGQIQRLVFDAGRGDYEFLIASGTYDHLVNQGLLVPHEEVPATEVHKDWDRRRIACVLRPRQIPFVSYAHEWGFSQLRDAALTTLTVQREALRFGMMLKDAPGTNIQFLDGRPVLIDTLSLVRAKGAAWPAYFQFCKHFLAPLLLTVYRDVRLMRLVAQQADGVPLDLAARLLPARSWLRPLAALHLHLHARANRRAATTPGLEREWFPPAPGRQTLVIESLLRGIERLQWSPPRTDWTAYADERPTYTDEAWAARLDAVSRILDRIRPSTVWDLGAATGHISRIATRSGAFTVALDADPSCVELTYLRARQDQDTRLLPLVQDLLCPSSPAGWAEHERPGLAERGPADLVLALGLIHHLAVPGGLPLVAILSYIRRLGRAALVEFVPSSDPVAVAWSRRFDTSRLNQSAFEEAAATHFTEVERLAIPGSQRMLYFLRNA